MSADLLRKALIYQGALVKHVRHCEICGPQHKPRCVNGKTLYDRMSDTIKDALGSEAGFISFERSVDEVLNLFPTEGEWKEY